MDMSGGLIIVLLVGGGLVLHHMGQERNVDVIELAEKGDSITRAGGRKSTDDSGQHSHVRRS